MSRWQLAEDANVTDEARKEINAYIDRRINTGYPQIEVIPPIPLNEIRIIYGSCPKE